MKKRKITAADRPQFRRDFRALMDKLKPEIGELTQDATMVCQKARDFDPSSNKLWELEVNHSAPRSDVRCAGCKEPLAVSNHAYARYKAMDKKPQTMCIECMVKTLGTTP